MNKKLVIMFSLVLTLSACDKVAKEPVEAEATKKEIVEEQVEVVKATEKEVDYGVIEDGSYKNSYFGLSIDIPQGWTVLSREQLDGVLDTGMEMMAGDDKNLSAAMQASKKQNFTLFAFLKYGLGAKVEFNPGIMAAAERVSAVPEIKKGSDYLFHTKKLLEASPLEVNFPRDNYTTQISGVSFDVMPVTMEMAGVLIQQNLYAAIIDDYALLLTTTYSNESELEEVNGYLDGLTFTN